jgi:hypothetical protein
LFLIVPLDLIPERRVVVSSKNKRIYRRISLALFFTNIVAALFAIFSKGVILMSGYDQQLYEMTGEMVPVWPEHVRNLSAIEISVAVAMLLSVILYWLGKQRVKIIFLLSLIFFRVFVKDNGPNQPLPA